MRDPLNKTITTIQPSGIRKFFDVVHEMKDAISLGVGEPILIRRGISATRVFIPWKKEEPFIPPMPV